MNTRVALPSAAKTVESDSVSSAPLQVQTTEQHDFDAVWRSRLDERKIEGNANRTLFAASLLGCVAVATAVLLSSTRNHLKDRMPILAGSVASSALVTAPPLAGSLIRLPASIALERYPSWLIHAFVMGVSMIGTFCLMILSFSTESDEVLGSGIFAAYVIFGLMGGFGVGLFSPGIATVSFWHPKSKQGSRNGIFGGVTNLAPGLFGLWIGPVMTQTSIGLTYVIWLLLGIVVMAVTLPHIYDSPFHQLLFFSRKLAEEHNVAMTEDQIGEIREIAREMYGQEIFPSGNVRATLTSSLHNYRTWQLVSLYIVSYGGYLGLTVYLPTFFTEEYGVSAASAVLLASAFSLVAGAMRILGGWLCDKITFMDGGVLINYASFTVIIIGSVVVVFAPSAGAAFTGSLFMSIGCGFSNAATFKILPRYIHSAVAGAAGWVGAMGALGSVIWPIFMGIIAMRFPQKSSFLLFAALGLGALLMMISVHMQLLTEDLREKREEAERCARQATFAEDRSRKISTTEVSASPASQSRVNVGGANLDFDTAPSDPQDFKRCEGDIELEDDVARERFASVNSRTGLVSPRTGLQPSPTGLVSSSGVDVSETSPRGSSEASASEDIAVSNSGDTDTESVSALSSSGEDNRSTVSDASGASSQGAQGGNGSAIPAGDQ